MYIGQTVFQNRLFFLVNEADADADIELDALYILLVKQYDVVPAHIHFRFLWLQTTLSQDA
jgi:hypothetical protein